MPQRFLRPGITTSDKFNSVPWDTQIFFVRLLTLVDDYGRYDAHPLLLKGHAFAMRPDVTVERIIEMRDELSKSGLVTFYEVMGKEFLQVEKWQERARTSSRYPSADGTESKPEGRVYFVIAKQSKRIKIGYTCYKPEARLSTLQTGSAEPLELLGVLVGGPELERELHRKHKGMSCGGEWFTDCPEIRQEIILGSLKTNGSDQPNLLPPSPSSLAIAIDHKPSSLGRSSVVPRSNDHRSSLVVSECVNGDKTGIGKDTLSTFNTISETLGNLYGRPKGSPVEYLTQQTMAGICRRPDIESEIWMVVEYRRKLPEKEKKFFPQSLGKLVEGWEDVVDRARNYKSVSGSLPGPRIYSASSLIAQAPVSQAVSQATEAEWQKMKEGLK